MAGNLIFTYRDVDYPLERGKLLASEAIWLERKTGGITPIQAEISLSRGGTLGGLYFLMLALHRAGQTSLANWERLNTINIATEDELSMRVEPDVPEQEGDEDPDPRGGSPSTSDVTGS